MKRKYTKGTDLNDYLAEKMKDRKFKNAWQNLDTEFELMESMIKAREKSGISQAELARRIGTKHQRYPGLKGAALIRRQSKRWKKSPMLLILSLL